MNGQGPQKGSVGVNILFTVIDQTNGQPKDISAALVLKLIIHRPDGLELSILNPQFNTNGQDGTLRYVTVDGDLSLAGSYRVQAYLELPSGFQGCTQSALFQVYRNPCEVCTTEAAA